MTRLFLRFYLGVVAVLIVAFFVMGYIFQQDGDQNIVVVENALGGGARLARDEYVRLDALGVPDPVPDIQSRFDFPIAKIEFQPDVMREQQIDRLRRGEVLLWGSGIYIMLPGEASLLRLGPLPRFVTPGFTKVLLGYGAIFLFAAIAIAVLLRPVISQLRSVERTATAIASGDLSARIEHERAVLHLPLAGAFNSMAGRVQSAMRSQRELMQAVSHELRTPLARIQFATELLRTTSDDQQRQSRIDAIDHATEQLDGLVGELLSYVRLDEPDQVRSLERVKVVDLIGKAIEMHSALHPDIEFEIDAINPNAELQTERDALLRAMGNLVGNAGKNATSRVTVHVKTEDQKWIFQVDDDGPGVPEADREVIFEAFRRLENSAAPSARSGTGLGLALVLRICARLDGTVHCLDSPLGGARFEMSLPLVPDSGVFARPV